MADQETVKKTLHIPVGDVERMSQAAQVASKPVLRWMVDTLRHAANEALRINR